MRPRLSVLIAPVVVALTGCGPGAPPVAPPSNQAVSAAAFVVWTRGADGAPRSRWLDAEGVERGQAAGQYVVRAGRLTRVTPTKVDVPLTGCTLTGEPVQPATGHGERVTLVDVAGAAVPPLVVAEPGALDGDGLGELEHGARVRGGLGRFLVIEETTYVFGCGAHGNNAVSATLFDVATGAAVAWPITDGDVAGFAPTILAGIGEDGLLDEAPVVHFGEALPVWRDGAPRLRHLLWLDTCYACSNGEWSSYTSGGWVEDARLPPAFAAEASAVPPAVARALSTLGADAAVELGVSWGAPDERWAATFTP